MVIRKIEYITPHAIDRMRERVIPWAHDQSDEFVMRVMRLLIENRDHEVLERSHGRINLQNPWLRFTYIPEAGKVLTVLPYRTLTKAELARLVEYYRPLREVAFAAI